MNQKVQFVLMNIIVGISFILFIWFTGWRGFLGFCIGIGTCAFLMLSNNEMLKWMVPYLDEMLGGKKKEEDFIDDEVIDVESKEVEGEKRE
jgi:hypothetical protein